jgi:hypothetical protein
MLPKKRERKRETMWKEMKEKGRRKCHWVMTRSRILKCQISFGFLAFWLFGFLAFWLFGLFHPQSQIRSENLISLRDS